MFKEQARQDILKAVRDYCDTYHNVDKGYNKGDRIPYASRVYDAEEMSTFFDRVLSTDQSAAYAEGSRRFFAQLGGASLRSWHYIQEELRAAGR